MAIAAISAQRHQPAGTSAAEEHRADRGVGDQRVEDHRDRGRHQRPERGRDRPRSRRRSRADSAPSRIIMRATIRPGPEASATALPLMPEKIRLETTLTCASPPRKSSDHRRAEGQQPLDHAARVHDVGDEDEQRHRDQQIAVVEPVHRLVDDEADILVGRHQIGEAGRQHRRGRAARRAPRRA